MKDMELSVPLIHQPEMSSECGIATVAMIAKYYKLGDSYGTIKQSIASYTWGTTTPQLGVYFLEKGFDVEIVGLHPALFTINTHFDDSQGLIAHLKGLRSVLKDGYDPITLEHFILFLQKGGTFVPRIPTAEDIKEEIFAKRPVLIPLSHWFLHPTTMSPRFTIHFNVVTGVKEQNFIVNDPDWGKCFGGSHTLAQETLMYSIYVSAKGGIDDACIMKIRKR